MLVFIAGCSRGSAFTAAAPARVADSVAVIHRDPRFSHLLPSGCITAALLRGDSVLPSIADTELRAGDELIMVFREGAECDLATLSS